MKKKLLVLLPLLLFAVPAFADEHEEEDKDFTYAFREGSLNLISANTFKPDTFYIQYSHNFFANSFPRGSNPAFLLSYAPIKNLQLDSVVTLRNSPVEWELAAKYQVLNEADGAPFSFSPRVAFSGRGNVVGVDLALSKIFFEDKLQLGLDYSFQSDAKSDWEAGMFNAIGANAIVRVWKHWNVYGDVFVPLNSALMAKNGFIWSAGLKKRIPDSPHILTLYVGNTNEASLSGRTISTSANKYPDALKVGFNFSIGIEDLSKMGKKLF